MEWANFYYNDLQESMHDDDDDDNNSNTKTSV